MITEHAVKSNKQAIRRVMSKMHTLTLEQFDYNINKFIDTVVEIKAVLESCEETDNSIASNLFRILGTAPCNEFKTWMLGHQTSYNDGAAFDLDNFMTSCKHKYTNHVADGLWKSSKKTKKDLEKESEIVALNSRFDNLEKLLYAQKNDKSNTSTNKSGWKRVVGRLLHQNPESLGKSLKMTKHGTGASFTSTGPPDITRITVVNVKQNETEIQPQTPKIQVLDLP